MPATRECPECGGAVAADAPQQLCPACLMRVGMAQTSARPDHPSLDVTTDFASETPSGAEEDDLPQAGETFGRYRLIRKLGEGGMGAVFEAEELDTGRIVALKLLKQSLRSADAKKRFFREGRLAASINHPNSVYVFGTEEIEGTPAIAMERVVGGTLEDRVKSKGPLPVGQAVDAILQIIDGLEAAAAVGVLHRDIKPSNCFVDESGGVKIGDFGLSISTTGRGDSHLTVAGSFLGTPAFSSPEQLRGDELDVRSDIYAVGVTLFYLLTGRTPHHAENMVKLLATVLEQAPPSPRDLRPNVPRGLAKVVLRCLAKQPGSRFKGYAELRAAVAPYSSVAPDAATLGLRTLAGFMDCMIVSLPWNWLALEERYIEGFAKLGGGGAGFPWELVSYAAALIVLMLYFAVPEGLYGLTIGKAICRLRVFDVDGEMLGFGRAALRFAIYYFAPLMLYYISAAIIGISLAGVESGGLSEPHLLVLALIGVFTYLLFALLFVTARRANGYAAVHDLAAGARVVRSRRKSQSRREPLPLAEEQTPKPGDGQKIGAYHVLRPLGDDPANPMWLAYDTRLLRRVWVREAPVDGFDQHDPKINVARPGRLRWIGSWIENDRRMVAYEALSGASLLDLCKTAQSWASVRFWLLDLAIELAAAESDGTLPDALSLDRVWITAEGRAKLLDFSAPGAEPAEASASPQEFLQNVAAAALRWKPDLSERKPDGAFIPVEAVGLLQRIAQEPVDSIAAELESLTSKKSRVSRRRRIAMLAATVALPLWIGVPLMLGASGAFFKAVDRNAMFGEVPSLRDDLSTIAALDEPSDEETGGTQGWASRKDWEIVIAGQYRKVVADEIVWSSERATALIPEEQRALAERIVAERSPSFEEFRTAASNVDPNGARDFAGSSQQDVNRMVDAFFLSVIIAWGFFVTFPSGLAALLDRRGRIARIFGVDYVTHRGTQAHRLRLFYRNFVVPLAFILLLVFGVTAVFHIGFRAAYGATYPSHAATQWGTWFNVGLVIVLAIISSLMKRRGLHDVLAGVFPVPH